MSRIIKVDRDTIKSIALMSMPAAMIAPVSIPIAIFTAVAFGKLISKNGSDGYYEFELPSSFGDWILKNNPVYEQRTLEEAKKKANVLYWTHKS